MSLSRRKSRAAKIKRERQLRHAERVLQFEEAMSSLVTAGWKVLPLAKLAANSKEAGLTRTVVFLDPPNEFRNKAYAIAGRIVPLIELTPFIEAL